MKKLSDYIGSFAYATTGYSDTLEKNITITTPTEALDTLIDLTASRKVTLLDNQVNYIVIGDTADDDALTLKYTMKNVITEQVGTVEVVHDDININIDHEQTGNPDLFNMVTSFAGDINGTEIRLAVTLTGVGTNLEFRYKIDSIKKLP